MPENGNMPDIERDKFRHLDRYLQDLPEAKKIKIYDLTLKMDIHPEDPMWLICLGLNQIFVLLEDTPSTLTEFTTQLEAWTTHHIKLLESLSRKAQTMEDLSQVSKELTIILMKLVEVSQELMQRSLTSDPNSETSLAKLKTSNKTIIKDLKKVREIQEQQNQRLNARLAPPPKIRNWSGNLSLVLSTVTLALVGFSTWQINSAQHILLDTAERSQWILRRTLVRDCQEGLKAADSQECQGL
ncbi:MAG: DUF6753 family protein [Cyanobacteria bacterium P01_G01_bin.19]